MALAIKDLVAGRELDVLIAEARGEHVHKWTGKTVLTDKVCVNEEVWKCNNKIELHICDGCGIKHYENLCMFHRKRFGWEIQLPYYVVTSGKQYSTSISDAWELIKDVKGMNLREREMFFLELKRLVDYDLHLRSLPVRRLPVPWPQALIYLEPEHICKAYLAVKNT